MSRPTRLIINLAALQHNLECVRTLAPNSKVMAMVKANAYGHGIIRVAQALSNADALGVASLEEALILREAKVQQPIVLMEGLFSETEINHTADQDFTLVIHHLPQVAMLEKTSNKKPFSIWLKINTGMNRLGIEPALLPGIYARLMRLENVKKPIGLMTHFAEADLLDHHATQQQIELFSDITIDLVGPRSLANSAGILAWQASHADWVRPGLMLYGASPFADKTGLDHDLRPVMTLKSQLIAIQSIKKGEKVGYGGTWVAPTDSLIGVVGVGYGDGYPQFAQNGTPVLVNEKMCPLVGRVSMDMLTVNLNNQPQAQVGDPVILLGEGLPAEIVARHSQTSAYEILTRMTPRPKVEII